MKKLKQLIEISAWKKIGLCIVIQLGFFTGVQGQTSNLTFIDDAAVSGITFSGTWSHISRAEASGGTISYSNETNASAEASFTGNGIRVYTQRGVGAGIFDIYVDDVKTQTYDSYNASQQNQVLAYENMNLTNGAHKIRIVNTGLNNASATGTNVHLDAFVYRTQPSAVSVQIYGNLSSSSQKVPVYLTFSDSVTGFTASDLAVTNATVDSISGFGKYYTAHLNTSTPGDVSVSLSADKVTLKGGSLQNTASNNFTLPVQFNAGSVSWLVDSDVEWQAAGSNQTGLIFTNGEAVPSGNNANYSSILKTYTSLMKPQNITFKQSPVWDNWTSSSNVGPSNAGDAPIFLPVANDDYYFFGRLNSLNLYVAWHSTDMVNWIQYGPIATGSNLGDGHFRIGRWMTSAEYKEGKFYIIGDVPNDEDPHLWIDDDLSDNTPAVYYDTAVFSDPSHGSDASLFRNDEDGLFHIIYEDWSPLNPRTHAWDSPLAGHTSSPDCINGFTPHKHHPAIDLRTTPTGTFGTYTHPGNVGDLTYEIHQPEQEAFGDWTTIKVGSQFYLFSDYDPVGQSMRTARFTSSSLYEEFKLVGTTGSGHPDPTVGFAEGQFYLITQQATDQISPGPWVEDVEARVGVDTSGNGTIDVWSNWTMVKETYDHKPGYARVVDVTPARLDLTSLPSGFGFRFEYRVTDQTSNASTPIMDKVEFIFEPTVTNIVYKNQSKGSIFYQEIISGISIFNYLVEVPGVAEFTVYDIKGNFIHSIKKQHNKSGRYQLNLNEKSFSNWYVIEYKSPGGGVKRISLTN